MARKRARNIELDSSDSKKEIEALMVTAYTENKKKNAADSAYKKARKSLQATMEDAKLKSHTFEGKYEGKKKIFSAKRVQKIFNYENN